MRPRNNPYIPLSARGEGTLSGGRGIFAFFLVADGIGYGLVVLVVVVVVFVQERREAG